MTSTNSLNQLEKENVLPFMAFVQRSADQQHRHGSFGRPLQKLSYIRDERLDILEAFSEQHEALLKSFETDLGHIRLAANSANLP